MGSHTARRAWPAAGRLTARIGQRAFASIKPLTDNPGGSWWLYAYELVAPDRVLVHNPDIEFWKRAVRDEIVTGTIEKREYGDQVNVTASPAEMAIVAQGYGAVSFETEVAFELRRQ